MIKKTLVISGLALLLSACGASGGSYDGQPYRKARTLDNFQDYVDYLDQRAVFEGVGKRTIERKGRNVRYIPKAVELDNSQAERAQRNRNRPATPNPNGVSNYLNRVLTQQKVDIAAKRYWEQLPALNQASRQYGVPNHYIMALWGMESSFGYYQGNYDVLSVLATLAFDGRREALFSQEYVNALKILQQDVIPRASMKGSWAGAMGQSQFMPTSFLQYAVDADGDGRKDIWKNQYDVFASIANYLSTVGWDKNLPWGVEVALDEPMSLDLAGTEHNKKRSLSSWQAMGVSLKSYNTTDMQRLQQLASADLWLVRPNKEAGRAFLVTNNYRTLLNWNNSNYFAVSIGMFADRIAQRINQ
ncbi:lytic transglycosylase [Chelonobacter oris]|uniref:Lytic transglycosylase n=1 Tax=Chelonobacter oris TaxID=505317 RepID=A0A0A3BCN9_9PAST|nr:lytic murein transglycosylase [Chelonobacter oris]KGQ71289.1 lytic transglycosylase [Chelonobacter oris]